MSSGDPFRNHPQLTADMVAELLASGTDPALRGLTPDELSVLIQKARTPAPPPPDSDLDRPQRWQDQLIEQHIPDGSSVLDLGCGGGELLARLIHGKHVRGQGVEVDPDAVFQCVARGVPVLQSDLDLGLKGFADQSFDYVVLEETLQMLHRPIDVLGEMLRVGRHGIVSFPNFAYWRVRMDLVLRGRMPTAERLPHRWYDTPNIHLFSLQDILDWAGSSGVGIVRGHALVEGDVRPLRPTDNLHAEEVLLVVERT